jgi:hypothetical protein
MRFHSGAKLVIELTTDALASLTEAESHVPDTHAACKAQLRRLLQRLAEIGTLKSPDQWNTEGNGFFAVKTRCGLRAYGWFHSSRRGVFVVSHFIYKQRQKLDPADIARAERNRQQLYESEKNGHRT